MEQEVISKLLSYEDRVWYQMQLMREPVFDHIPKEELEDVIQSCVQRGLDLVEQYRELEGYIPFEEWFEQRNVSICSKEEIQAPPLILFASVSTKPARVDIYTDALSKALSSLSSDSQWPDGEAPEMDLLRQVVLAHECFHILEEDDLKHRYNYTVHYKIGPLQRSATLRQTTEVSAAVFAKEICGLRFNPGILDVALLTAYDKKGKDSAQTFLKSLEHIRLQQNELFKA